MPQRSRWLPWLVLFLLFAGSSLRADDRTDPWATKYLRRLSQVVPTVPLILEGRAPIRTAFTVFVTGAEVRSPAETIAGLALLRDHYGYPIHGVWIETQHIRFSPQEIRPFVTMAKLAGFHTIVRVPTEHRSDVQGYLDTGAGGLVIPVVERPEQIREAFDHTFFRAAREAGFAPDLANLQQSDREHRDEVDDEKVLAFMIESIAGTEHIAELVAEATALCERYRIPRRHIVFWVGPYDLRLDIERRSDAAAVTSATTALGKVAKVVNTAGFSMGGHMGTLAAGEKMMTEQEYRIFTIAGMADATFNPNAVGPAHLFHNVDDSLRARFRQPARLSEGEAAALAAEAGCLQQMAEESRRGTP